MNPFRWMAEKLGLVQSAEDALIVGTLTKLQVVGAISRATTRHQVEAYLADLEAAGQTALAATIRGELAAQGLLPTALPPAVSVAAVAADPAAVPSTGKPALPPAPEKRKPGRPRKAQPSVPADSFRAANTR